MLAHKTSLQKFRKVGIVKNIFSDQNEMKPERFQKENWKIYKYVEIEHYLKQQMSQGINHKGNVKIY